MDCQLFSFHCVQQKAMVEFVQGSNKVRVFHEDACAALMIMGSMDREGKNVDGEIC